MTDAANVTTDMRSVRFRKEREAGWTRLEALVMKVERSGMTSLNFAEARDLASFYRQTVNSLSVAREISLDRALLAYLENLAARAYLVIYAPQARITSVVARLFTPRYSAGGAAVRWRAADRLWPDVHGRAAGLFPLSTGQQLVLHLRPRRVGRRPHPPPQAPPCWSARFTGRTIR